MWLCQITNWLNIFEICPSSLHNLKMAYTLASRMLIIISIRCILLDKSANFCKANKEKEHNK